MGTTASRVQTVETLKRLVVAVALCRCCFCFYCPGIHDGLMNGVPVSDGLQCPRRSRLHIITGTLLGVSHILRHSAASRPSNGCVFMLLFSWRAATTGAGRAGKGALCSVTDTVVSLNAFSQKSDFVNQAQLFHTFSTSLPVIDQI